MQSGRLLTVKELAEGFETRLQHSKKLPAAQITAVGKAVSRLIKTGVEVEVPAKVAAAIRSGSLQRTGGVVRDNSGRIRHILQDPGKAASVLKSPVVVIMALDFAESALLNEKLKEIQEQLDRIEGKIDDLTHSKINAAFHEASNIVYYKNPEDRRIRMHAALNMISEAIPLLDHRMARKSEEVKEKARIHSNDDFFWPFSRRKCRDAVFEHASEIHKDLTVKAALLALRARIQEELGEHAAAAESRKELTVTCLHWDEFFNDVFGFDGMLIPRIGKEPSLPVIAVQSLLINIVQDVSYELKKERARETKKLSFAFSRDASQLSHAALIQDAAGFAVPLDE
jgi:hypothetical protein